MFSEHYFRTDVLALVNERMIHMKEQYISEIVNLLNQCNDPSLFDLILKLLQKS